MNLTFIFTLNDKVDGLKESLLAITEQSVTYWNVVIFVDQKLINKTEKIISNLEIKKTLRKKLTIISIRNDSYLFAINKFIANDKSTLIALARINYTISKNLVYEVMKCALLNPSAQIIYSDEDQISKNQVRHSPFFKPKISLDYLYSYNYIGDFFYIKKDFLKKLGGLDAKVIYNRSLQIILKTIETDSHDNFKNLPKIIVHIPLVLHHRRGYLNEEVEYRLSKKTEYLKILNDHFKNLNFIVKIRLLNNSLFRIKWAIPDRPPLVSIIIPTKNQYALLKKCVSSIIEKTTYVNYEIIIIDNNTNEAKCLSYLKSLTSKFSNIKVLKYRGVFNYSKINNWAVNKSNGELICLLNNDTEIISSCWLSEMVSNAIRKDIGCVGAMLYYSDMTIQHAGVSLGIHGVADHQFKGLNKVRENDYFNYLYAPRNPSAVTAACLVIKKILYQKIGGLDELNLKIAFNDVDLCLKVEKLSLRNIWTPYAELFHYESKSRVHLKNSNEKNEAYFLRMKHHIAINKNLEIFHPIFNPAP